MSYDNTFYEQYEAYLRERTVREAHDWIFSLVASDYPFRNVVDLGCGRSQEFYHCANPRYYLGVDENVEENEPSFEYTLLKANYREKVRWEGMTAFVSLFSCEITAPFPQNYVYYNALFALNPDIQAGLVSGFFYANRKHENPVVETGGIKSWQTLEAPDGVVSSLFSEKRIIQPVPSKMFGPDVFEVWKIFNRI
jgi:hypothetical protein